MKPYRIFVVHRGSGVKVLELDFDGKRLTESQTSTLTSFCLSSNSKITDLAFLRESEDLKLQEQLNNIGTAMKEMKLQFNTKQVHLTKREQQVMVGVLRGDRNKEIARDTNISERTVKFHVSSLLWKFKVQSRTELALKYHRSVMLPQEEVA